MFFRPNESYALQFTLWPQASVLAISSLAKGFECRSVFNCMKASVYNWYKEAVVSETELSPLLYPGEIALLEGLTVVYKSNIDLYFYVIGSSHENEVG